MPDLKGGTRFAALRRFPSVAKRTGRPSGSLVGEAAGSFSAAERGNPEPVPPHRYGAGHGAGPEKAMKPLKIKALRVGTPEGIKSALLGPGGRKLMTCVVVRSLRSPPSPRSH